MDMTWEVPLQKLEIGGDTLAAPAPTGGRVEDDEDTPVGTVAVQSRSSSSKVWTPPSYHSSRNGQVSTSSIVRASVMGWS